MREKLKTVYFLIQKLMRKDARLLEKIRREDLLVVLNLHQVSPHQNPFWSPMHPQIFEDLLIFLKENFEVILFGDLDSSSSKKPSAILSFDDGYYNFIEYAVPLLEKHGLRANMNVIPSCVESGEPMWNVKLYDFLNSAPKSLIDEIRLPAFEYSLKDESFDGKVQYGLKISRFLKNRPRRERRELWRKIENLMENHDFQRTRMMNPEEIRQIAEIHEIGVHSFSHESMEFEENAFFEDDLQKCLKYFDEKLHLPLEIYAFPNGSFRPEQIEILRKYGIKYQLLVEERYAQKNAGVFPRFTIYGGTKLESRFQALGFNEKI
jgi:peptidoglycan/xylan/chitin deacetylase (PgdA/CDA1 family)